MSKLQEISSDLGGGGGFISIRKDQEPEKVTNMATSDGILELTFVDKTKHPLHVAIYEHIQANPSNLGIYGHFVAIGLDVCGFDTEVL